MLCQGAAECANFCSIYTKLQHLANATINAGFVMIQSARVGVGRFAEGVRARDFPLSTDPKNERRGVCGWKIAGLTQSCKKYYRKRDAGDCVASAIIDADADD